MKYGIGPAYILDAIFLTRPVLLIPVWGFCVFGYYRGMILSGHKWNFHVVPDKATMSFFLWMVVFSLAVSAIYVLNQIADIDVDRENSGMPLLAKGNISASTARITSIICAAGSMALPLLFHPALAFFSFAALLTGIIYSFRPTYFSGRCILDFISNGTGYGIIAFGTGWYLSGAGTGGFFMSAFPYFLLMCAGSISSTLPDYIGDKKCGKNTTAVILGIKNAHILALIIILSDIVLSYIVNDVVVLICAAGALPLYIIYLVRPIEVFMEATYKAGGLLCMIVAFVLMPVNAAAAFLIALSTWLYFRLRFHVNYPSLKPAKVQ
jgi:4-hydroxybenzoate polyprenyltransferase